MNPNAKGLGGRLILFTKFGRCRFSRRRWHRRNTFFETRYRISFDYASVSYATAEDAIGLIKSVGQNCFLAKTDVKNAFRLIPIRLAAILSCFRTESRRQRKLKHKT